ncbi:unnamed protein product [Prorocentrum cordatum]|uniref:H(+)-exporting diphosphatase n=1 Tax=Prorocentrum cordatum TaxID=2364126 RepID=A0ABN9W517_9DINO|nr:unnamed protein product [Polarella glacialis]
MEAAAAAAGPRGGRLQPAAARLPGRGGPAHAHGCGVERRRGQVRNQPLRYFEYALLEQEAALGSEAAAAADVAAATEDQVLVAQLEAKAAEEQGVALEEVEGAVEKEAGAAEFGGGEAAEEAAADIAAEVDAAAEAAMAAGEGAVAEGASAAAAEGAAAAAAEGAGLAVAEGAGAAAADGIGVAVAEGGTLAAVEAGAVGAEVASGGLATPVVVAGAAAAAAVLEGPKLVAGATAEWGAASAEIQAARDETLAVEKEVEAQSFEAAAGVFQAGAVEQEGAAAASAAAGVGLVVLAQVAQLGALAAQAPVAAAFLLGKAGSAASALGCAAHGGPHAGGVLLAATSSVSLVAFLGTFLMEPWAETVLEAAKAQGSGGGDVVAELRGAVNGVAAKFAAAPDGGRRLNWLWDQTMGAAKQMIVGAPNKETTTVPQPTTLPPPADPPSLPQLVLGALFSVAGAILRWLWPVLADIALGSLAVAVVLGIPSLGARLPQFSCGCRSPGLVCADLARDVLSQWLSGLAALGAVWLVSLLLAPQLQGVAEGIRADARAGGGGTLAVASLVLGGICLGVSFYRAHASASEPCRLCACPLEGDSPAAAGACCVGAGCLCATASAALGAALAALEAPICSAALGGAGRSLAASWWLLPLLPWELVAHRMLEHLPGWMRPLAWLHVPVLLAFGIAATGLATWALLRARRKSGERLAFLSEDWQSDLESDAELVKGH